MWSSLYLALFALAAGATYVYAVEEEAVVFSAAIAGATWSMLALTGGQIEIVLEGGVETIGAGAVQWLFCGFALLSFFALLGAVLGWYPETEQEVHPDYDPR